MEYGQVNDYETLYLINDNNENAYGIIYYKYKPLISSLANGFLKKFYNIGVEFDDLFQEGMIGLSEAINNYNINNENTFYTFALICIKREMQRLIIHATRGKNLILNSARSINETLLNGEIELQDTLFNEANFTEKNLEENDFYKKILNLKYELNERYMPIYELKINGFSNSEIAVLLDISYKKVDNALYNIRKYIKKIIF